MIMRTGEESVPELHGRILSMIYKVAGTIVTKKTIGNYAVKD